MLSPTAFGEQCKQRKPARNPSKPETLPENILHNLHCQHEATYAQECTYHVSLPPLILGLVLVLVLLLLVHQGNRPGTLSASATRSFSIRSGTSRLEPCLDPPEPIQNLGALPGTCPGTFPNPHAPEPWNPAQNLPQNLDRNPSQNLVPQDTPEPAREPVVRKPPRNCPGTYIG